MRNDRQGESGDVTRLLAKWGKGDAAADEALANLVYETLHRQARKLFHSERPQTIQATALVHEAYEKLIGADIEWNDRVHFYALAARMMKRLLINHAKGRRAAKRGGGKLPVTFDDQLATPSTDQALLDLGEALNALAELDQRKAELVELQYFAGLSLKELASATRLSEATVGRDLRFAKAWLKNWLQESR